jgi:endonuclease/exonuclease/phosphatase family metal-dependent hydrolase
VGDIGDHPRNLQYVILEHASGRIAIANIHGLWNGKGKTDSPERIIQSEYIVKFVRSQTCPTVVIGDFNLLPDTESVKLLEASSLRNLIKEYGINSTRTSFYKKTETFADYAFVTSDIRVKQFSVLSDEVSDHAPLLLEIEVS